MEPLETLRTNRYWMAKRALLDIPIVDGALSPETFTQVVLYTDAQATIAALQARVQELEQWVQDQSTANLETMRHTDEMQSRALEAEQQLTQRTAELARVRKKLVETSLYLQQERANRDSLAACVDRDVKTIKELRTLVLALPKVAFRCEVDEKRDPEDDMFPMYGYTGSECHGTFAAFQSKETAQAVAALLQHRQGME